MRPNPPFDPTVCACPQDQANCRTQPGHLLPGQVETILGHLGSSKDDAPKWFWNSPGMVLAKGTETFRLRTITPRFENGHCVFYEAGRCRIHEVAPFGCRYFDMHMSVPEGQRRSMWGLQKILAELPKYETERDALPLATHYKGRICI